jgi:hypothetical protein
MPNWLNNGNAGKNKLAGWLTGSEDRECQADGWYDRITDLLRLSGRVLHRPASRSRPTVMSKTLLTLFFKPFEKDPSYDLGIRPTEAAGGVLKTLVDEGTNP